MKLFGIDFHMSWPLALAVYFTFWWTLLFAALPLGVKSLHETDEGVPGADPGAPVAPNIWRKAGLTSLFAAIAFVILVAVLNWTAE
jgi:predicted secreted protein